MRSNRGTTNKFGNPDSYATIKLGGNEFSALRQENANGVFRSGQILADATGTGEDLYQQGRAMFINGVGAQSFQDVSTVANVYLAIPITGQNGLVTINSYDQAAGAIITFQVALANTGASTLNIGQTTGSLIGAKKILNGSGTELIVGDFSADDRIQAQYDPIADSSNGAWIFIGKYSPSVFNNSLDDLPVGDWRKPFLSQLDVYFASSPLWEIVMAGATYDKSTDPQYTRWFSNWGIIGNTYTPENFDGRFTRLSAARAVGNLQAESFSPHTHVQYHTAVSAGMQQGISDYRLSDSEASPITGAAIGAGTENVPVNIAEWLYVKIA